MNESVTSCLESMGDQWNHEAIVEILARKQQARSRGGRALGGRA
jgi:hypothetical protein